jgi:putative addiction module component (TIGR02574 family)
VSSKEILREAMALPLGERVALAQTLWQSIEGQTSGKVSEEVSWALGEADRRDTQLSSGQAGGRTHEEVMRAARKAIE